MSANPAVATDNLLAGDVIENPYSYFRQLRENSPIHWNPQWDAWLLTRYEDVAQVLRRHDVFASDRATFYADYLPTPKKDFYDIVFHVYPRWLAGGDPPLHDHMRRIVNSNWTPSKMNGLRAQIRGMIDQLLDVLPTNKPVDLVEAFAVPLPATVISSVIGIPKDEWPAIKRWSDAWGALHFSPDNNVDRWDRGASALKEFYAYVANRLKETKLVKGNDYFAKMLNAEFEGDRLKDDEITVHIMEQLFAGHETTTNLIGNGVLLLMQNRAQWEHLCSEPSLATSTVEEILRYEGPVKMITRWAKQEFKIGDTTIPKGGKLLLVLAAANRDPAQFANPEDFNIGRSPNNHLTFGQGIHFCLGAPLARLEGEEVFRALSERFPKLQLAGSELRHRPIMRARALDSLPVRLG
jgi:cytochrome P450